MFMRVVPDVPVLRPVRGSSVLDSDKALATGEPLRNIAKRVSISPAGKLGGMLARGDMLTKADTECAA